MTKILSKIRHEPVAFWGGLAGALLAALAFFGLVDEQTIGLITVLLGAVGIPVVRQQVTPTAATAAPTDPGPDDAAPPAPVGDVPEDASQVP